MNKDFPMMKGKMENRKNEFDIDLNNILDLY